MTLWSASSTFQYALSYRTAGLASPMRPLRYWCIGFKGVLFGCYNEMDVNHHEEMNNQVYGIPVYTIRIGLVSSLLAVYQSLFKVVSFLKLHLCRFQKPAFHRFIRDQRVMLGTPDGHFDRKRFVQRIGPQLVAVVAAGLYSKVSFDRDSGLNW